MAPNSSSVSISQRESGFQRHIVIDFVPVERDPRKTWTAAGGRGWQGVIEASSLSLYRYTLVYLALRFHSIHALNSCSTNTRASSRVIGFFGR